MSAKEIGFAFSITTLVISVFFLLQMVLDLPAGLVASEGPFHSATFLNQNYLASYLLFSLPFAVFYFTFLEPEENWKRTIPLLAIIMGGLTFLLSRSQGAFVAAGGAILAIGGFSLVKNRNNKIAPAVISILVLVIPAVLFFLIIKKSQFFYRISALIGVEKQSVSDRMVAWRVGLKIIEKEGGNGIGAGNFSRYRKKHSAEILSQEQYRTVTAVPRTLHNEYLAATVELGGIGGLLFFIMLGAAIYLASRMWFRSDEGLGTFSLACLFSFLGMIFHSWIHHSFFQAGVGSQFVLVLGFLASREYEHRRGRGEGGTVSETDGSFISRGGKLAVFVVSGLLLFFQTNHMLAHYWFERADQAFLKMKTEQNKNQSIQLLDHSYGFYHRALSWKSDFRMARLNYLDLLQDPLLQKLYKDKNEGQTKGSSGEGGSKEIDLNPLQYLPELRDPESEYEKQIRILLEKWPEEPLIYLKRGGYKTNAVSSGKIKGKKRTKFIQAAEKQFKEALKRNPNLPAVYKELAWLVSQEPSRLEEATGLLEEGVKCDPKSSEMTFQLTAIYRAQGEFHKAIDVLRNFLEVVKKKHPARETAQFLLREIKQIQKEREEK